MKYLIEFEYDRSKADETIKLNMDFMKEMEKYPSKYYRYLYPPQYISNGKGFSIVEINDSMQMINTQIFLEKGFNMTFTPITDIEEQIVTYMAHKK
jgi:hypothetical protein